MRPQALVAGLAGAAVLLTAACGGVGAASPHGAPRPAAAANKRSAKRAATSHSYRAAPGVALQRLAPPSGSTVHAVCRPRTDIGTMTAPGVTVRTRPESSAPAIATFGRTNEQGARQVFDLLGQTTGAGGHLWYRALLPLRPNDTIGYIPADHVRVTWTDYWLLVERTRFRLTLFQSCRRVGVFPVGIGTGSTPTPVGYFYLQALLRPSDPNGVYGPYAYGLSGFSAVIHDWRWGGLVGLHGTDDPAGIGHDVSHGCIRMFNADIERLVRILPLGTPITIV
jgi:L,D-transpeptidase catalytic domain